MIVVQLCQQIIKNEPCGRVARYRFTWPGNDESAVCEDCSKRVTNIAKAMGMTLQLIPFGKDTNMPDTKELNAEWKKADLDGYLLWRFEVPTRIEGFEYRGACDGIVTSLAIGPEEQLLQVVPVEAIATGSRQLLLPAVEVGSQLRVQTSGFTGELRPIGIEVQGKSASPEEVCQFIDRRLRLALEQAGALGDFDNLAVSGEVAGRLVSTGIAVAQKHGVSRELLTAAILGAVEEAYKQ